MMLVKMLVTIQQQYPFTSVSVQVNGHRPMWLLHVSTRWKLWKRLKVTGRDVNRLKKHTTEFFPAVNVTGPYFLTCHWGGRGWCHQSFLMWCCQRLHMVPAGTLSLLHVRLRVQDTPSMKCSLFIKRSASQDPRCSDWSCISGYQQKTDGCVGQAG